jgi:acetyl esterase
MDPHFKAMLDGLAAATPPDLPPLSALPASVVRAGYQAQRTAANQTAPRDVAARDLTVAGAAGPLAARLYEPPGVASPSPGLVYFHGGGFAIGDLETHDGLCRRLAKAAGLRVLSVDYRLAPEHPFPCGHDDAAEATRWAFDHAGEIGFDPARIAVGGDSAGGTLTATTAIALRDDPARRIAFQLMLYPGIWPEVETESRKTLDGPLLTKEAIAWFEACLAADAHPEAARASPGRQEDLARLPPALVTTAGYDPLKDEGRDYAERLRAAGVEVRHIEYPDLIHDFYTMSDVSPAVLAAIEDAAQALKRALA